MVELKDVIHLYLGCQCVTDGQLEEEHIAKMVGICYDEVQILNEYHNQHGECPIDRVKPILRSLSSMTEEDALVVAQMESDIFLFIEIARISKQAIGFEFEYSSSRRRRGRTVLFDSLSPNQFAYLLSKGYDLFDLIPRNLAIDSTKTT